MTFGLGDTGDSCNLLPESFPSLRKIKVSQSGNQATRKPSGKSFFFCFFFSHVSSPELKYYSTMVGGTALCADTITDHNPNPNT